MDPSRVRFRYDPERLVLYSIPMKQIWVVLCGAVLALTAGALPAQAQQAAKEVESAVQGVYEGRVVLPDPKNIWTGKKITEQKCTVSVRQHEPGSLSVESDFTEKPVIVHADGVPGEPYYTGTFGDDQTFVLQLWPPHGVISLTHTSVDKNGRLNDGSKGSGNYTRECLIQPT